MLKTTNLSVFIGTQDILKNISVAIPSGCITLLIGKSGAGKTTLLRTLAGLIKPASGAVTIAGISAEKINTQSRAQKIGFVFQDFNLFAHMTVLQNCIDPLLLQGVNRSDAVKRATEILTQLGMNEKSNAYPKNLSGGQQQRAAIARALCLQPAVLLLDEPTASLDPENSGILTDILRKLTQKGLTVIVSTQDMNFARTINERIILMQNGEIAQDCNRPSECFGCLQIKNFIKADLSDKT